MNQEQAIALLRQILLFVGGIFVGKGYVDAATMTTIVAGMVALATVLWGQYARRNNALIASAAALPQVSRIVTTEAIANKIPNKAVVSFEDAKNSTPPQPLGA